MKYKNTKTGFTVLELVLGIAVSVILAVTATVYVRTAIVSVSSDSAVRDLTSAIRSARGHAAAGDLGAAWGVRTIHGASGGADRFEIFATTTGVSFASSSTLPADEIHQLLPGASWGEVADRTIIFYPARSTTTPTTFLVQYSAGVARVNVGVYGDLSIQ